MPGGARIAAARVMWAAATSLAAFGAAATLMFAPVAPACAQAVSPEGERALERRVKAAFLFRFTEFIVWPESAYPKPDAPFLIAVVARDGLVDELRQVTAGRSVGGHPVEVRRVTEGEMPPAQIVFVAESEKARLREWIRAAPRHALIVTESDGALALGSVINFLLVENRVRFEISLDMAEKRGLRMSSRLLAVAQGVRSGTP